MLNKLDLKSKILIVVAAVVIIGAGSFILVKKQATDLASSFDLAQYINYQDADLNEAQKSMYDDAKAKLAENSLDKNALIDLANVHAFKDDNNAAEAIFNHVLNIAPGDTIALQNLASVYHNTKRYDEAEQAYYKIIDAGTLWMPAYESLSQLYRFKLVADNPRFVEHVQRTREADYTDQYQNDFLTMPGFYYQYKGDNSSAIDYFRQYLIRVPDDKVIQGVFKDLGGSAIEFK